MTVQSIDYRLREYLNNIIYRPETAKLDRCGLQESENRLADTMDMLLKFILEERTFANELSSGNIQRVRLPSPENVICDPIKSVYGMLQHLIWLMDRITAGDYEQRLQFSNDLSSSFNAMLEHLVNLAYLSYHDRLTNLLNVEGFDEHCKILLENWPADDKYFLISININDFRRFIMLYGPEKADWVLVKVANFLRDICKNREICARVNADNFLCLLRGGSIHEIMIRLHDNEQKIHQFITFRSRLFHYGIYEVRDVHENLRKMRAYAMFAGANACSNTNGFSVFDDLLSKRYALENSILPLFSHALKNNEITVYYQPKIDSRLDVIAGSEALVRWILPNGEVMRPNHFIDLLEKNSLIVLLDFYVLRKVCQHIRSRLNHHQYIVPVSVNFSRVHMLDTTTVPHMLAILQEYNVDPQWIVIEITERVFFERMENMVKMIQCLRQVGFKVSMDDFGSSYSSLNFLKNIPVDEIKIDKLFFDDFDTDERVRILLSDVLTIANHLQLGVVAEGVETEDAVIFLKRQQYVMIQGFYYYAPMPEDEYNNRLDAIHIH
ncbi:MAG: GGDEF domain-containing protein [Megasphaera sp.]|jgi:EAL domain-containing protein (putative c-di-GMP-specific phosphodiesterase class I)/GGDEF domain-containing protein|nr:GGDEF domain-containing protein [Megasphaera sp.]